MNKSLVFVAVGAAFLTEPVLAKPEFSGRIWAGFATYKDNDPDWNFVYSLDATLSGATDVGAAEVGYVLQFGGEVARPSDNWKLGEETIDIEVYGDFGNAGLLRFTTTDRCDSSNWISGGIIETSITSSLGATSDFGSTFSNSAFRCAGGDGANSHFVYENSFAGIDWRVFADPDKLYDGDYIGDGEKFEDAAQVELEANFELAGVNMTVGTNDLKDFRAEVSTDIGDTPFGVYGLYEKGDQEDQKSQVILSYAPENVAFLNSIRLGFEQSSYNGFDDETNAIIQASFEKEDWTLDVAYDDNKDFAMEGFYYLNEQFEVGVGLSHLSQTHENSYEIGVGFSF